MLWACTEEVSRSTHGTTRNELSSKKSIPLVAMVAMMLSHFRFSIFPKNFEKISTFLPHKVMQLIMLTAFNGIQFMVLMVYYWYTNGILMVY